MSAYTSKFNLNDTAYIVNADLLTLQTVVITDIRVRESLSLPASVPGYLVTYRGRTDSSQKEYNESDLYFLDEAKVALEVLLAQKTSAFRSLR